MKYKFSTKFWLGLFLVISSLIIGKITTFTFFYYIDNKLILWSSVIVYIISWPMLVIGLIWIGEEYGKSIRKYVSYRFYHELIQKHTKIAYHKTKEKLTRKKNKNSADNNSL